jgi:hypothetical protein
LNGLLNGVCRANDVPTGCDVPPRSNVRMLDNIDA